MTLFKLNNGVDYTFVSLLLSDLAGIVEVTGMPRRRPINGDALEEVKQLWVPIRCAR